MCCHKQFNIVPPLCEPIQCGAVLNALVDGAIPDSDGDNISEKNREYSELTAHYYAWKNIDAEYYGFCHYRRFFCADESTKHPYIAIGTLSDKDKSKFLADDEYWTKLITEYPIIVPKNEDMGLSVKDRYFSARYQHKEDLELFLKILYAKAPHLYETAEWYLSQSKQYFCNMFIMDKAHFYEYCETLFPVLEEFDKHKTLHGNYQSDRTDGYLGEIFTGIYINYCKKNSTPIKEVPRLDIGCTVAKRLGYIFFPPESKRRIWVKKLVKKIRGN